MGNKSLFFEPYTKSCRNFNSSTIKTVEENFLLTNTEVFPDAKMSNDFKESLDKMYFDKFYISDLAKSFNRYIQSVIPEIKTSILAHDKLKLERLSNSLICILAYFYADNGLKLALDLDKAIKSENYIYAKKVFSYLEVEINKIEKTIESF